MTLPGNILSPIPGVNPSGQNLRYDSVYEKVKEARREEEDLPQGEWSRVVQTADPVQVIRLTVLPYGDADSIESLKWSDATYGAVERVNAAVRRRENPRPIAQQRP